MRRFSVGGVLLALSVVLMVADTGQGRPRRRHSSHSSSSNHSSSSSHSNDLHFSGSSSSSDSSHYPDSSNPRLTHGQLQQLVQQAYDRLFTDASTDQKRTALAEQIRNGQGLWKKGMVLQQPLNDLRARIDGSTKDPDSAELIQQLRGQIQSQRTAREALAKALEKDDLNHWRLVDPDALPPALARSLWQTRGLVLGLHHLDREALRDRTTRPDVVEIRRALVAVGSRQELEDVARRLAQDTSVRAFLHGHASSALQLLPDDGPSDHAAQLLRDLKTMMARQESAPLAPAGNTGPAPEEKPGAPRGPPHGLALLLPEAEGASYRPPVDEQAGAGLPELKAVRSMVREEVAELQKQVDESSRLSPEQELEAAHASFRHKHEKDLNTFLRRWIARREPARGDYPPCLADVLRPLFARGSNARESIEHIDHLLAIAALLLAEPSLKENGIHLERVNWGSLYLEQFLLKEFYADLSDLDSLEILHLKVNLSIAAMRILKYRTSEQRTRAIEENAEKHLGRRLTECERIFAIYLYSSDPDGPPPDGKALADSLQQMEQFARTATK